MVQGQRGSAMPHAAKSSIVRVITSLSKFITDILVNEQTLHPDSTKDHLLPEHFKSPERITGGHEEVSIGTIATF